MNGITVKKLLKACKLEMKKGNGNKVVLISDDDEGNGFHTLFYRFTDAEEYRGVENRYFHDGQNIEDVVLLG